MTDDTPYIFVDNQKIFPIERSPRPDGASAERKGIEKDAFGVVDRVTISRKARETYRCCAARSGTDSPVFTDLSNQSSGGSVVLSAYSPNRLR